MAEVNMNINDSAVYRDREVPSTSKEVFIEVQIRGGIQLRQSDVNQLMKSGYIHFVEGKLEFNGSNLLEVQDKEYCSTPIKFKLA